MMSSESTNPPQSETMRITPILVAITLCLPCLVNAQQVGDRVRVVDASGTKIVGEIQELDQNYIELLLENQRRRRVSLSDITEMSVSNGIDGNAGAGALGGAALGGLIGVGIGFLFSNFSDAPKRDDDGSSAGIFVVSIVASAAPIALVGAGIGLLFRTEEWTEVSIDEMASLKPVIYAMPDGPIAFGARITF